MKITIKCPAITLVGCVYFITFGLAPIWAPFLLVAKNVIWERLYLGPAVALAVLILCLILERTKPKF